MAYCKADSGGGLTVDHGGANDGSDFGGAAIGRTTLVGGGTFGRGAVAGVRAFCGGAVTGMGQTAAV